ncbi:hypothetical protein V8C42DRAFT_336341 [Trichoderma barbatum]
MLVASEETFGPFDPIFSFEAEQDTIRLDSYTEFGLGKFSDLVRARNLLTVKDRTYELVGPTPTQHWKQGLSGGYLDHVVKMN